MATAEASNGYDVNQVVSTSWSKSFGEATGAAKTLLEKLLEVNGQDAYDGVSASIGKLNRSHWLQVPKNINLVDTAPNMVGQAGAHKYLTPEEWIQVYAANKAVAPVDADPVKFALLRMEAVKCGWLDLLNLKEVTRCDGPSVSDALTTFTADAAAVMDALESARALAFLLPLIAEHVFRTMGHHYITEDSATYVERYRATFKACLMPHLANYLIPGVLFHAALHWVSPGRAWAVLRAQLDTQNIPDAIKIRANAAPAGTAIITTTAAVIESLSAVNLKDAFVKHGGMDLDLIATMTAKIKLNPPKYHKAYFAYGIAPITAAERTELEDVKAIAIRFAPYAQAFISTYLQNADLGKARALKKHADQNPIAIKTASNLFRAIAKTQPDSIEALFKTSLDKSNLDN